MEENQKRRIFPVEAPARLYETGFENDNFGRKDLSGKLSRLVENVDDPLVIALDDAWGSGKTYFLKRWVGAHSMENEGKALTIYFDAFETDYLVEPLAALVAAFDARIPKDDERKAWDVAKGRLRGLSRFMGKGLVEVAKASAGPLLASQGMGPEFLAPLTGAIDHSFDTVSGSIGKEAESNSPVDIVADFRRRLSELAGKTDGIVVVIDELDRCRPDHALTLLELVKHLFSVDNVHFILGINSRAMESIVRARYGEGIDAERYLRKFINFKIQLPKHLGDPLEPRQQPVIASYICSQAQAMGLSQKRALEAKDFFAALSEVHDFTMRDANQILTRIFLSASTVDFDKETEFAVGLRLSFCAICICEPSLFEKLVKGEHARDEIFKFFGITTLPAAKAASSVLTERIRQIRCAEFLYACNSLTEREKLEWSGYLESLASRVNQLPIENGYARRKFTSEILNMFPY